MKAWVNNVHKVRLQGCTRFSKNTIWPINSFCLKLYATLYYTLLYSSFVKLFSTLLHWNKRLRVLLVNIISYFFGVLINLFLNAFIAFMQCLIVEDSTVFISYVLIFLPSINHCIIILLFPFIDRFTWSGKAFRGGQSWMQHLHLQVKLYFDNWLCRALKKVCSATSIWPIMSDCLSVGWSVIIFWKCRKLHITIAMLLSNYLSCTSHFSFFMCGKNLYLFFHGWKWFWIDITNLFPFSKKMILMFL